MKKFIVSLMILAFVLCAGGISVVGAETTVTTLTDIPYYGSANVVIG